MNKSTNKNSRVRNDLFDPKLGLDRGRGKIVESCWYLTKVCFFLTALPWPSGLKIFLLRIFGAKVGAGVCIKPRVNIHLPWKLTIGDHSWLGEECALLNLEQITIGSNACISQRSFICTGNHDFKRPDMAYRNASIEIGDGVWIGANVFVAPGVSIGFDTVVLACSAVFSSLPSSQIYGGVPATFIRPRWADSTKPPI